METAKAHKVRFLLPDDEFERSEDVQKHLRKKFDKKISKMVLPPPPSHPLQITDPDLLLVELKRKLMALDRTIKLGDTIFEDDELEEHQEEADDHINHILPQQEDTNAAEPSTETIATNSVTTTTPINDDTGFNPLSPTAVTTTAVVAAAQTPSTTAVTQSTSTNTSSTMQINAKRPPLPSGKKPAPAAEVTPHSDAIKTAYKPKYVPTPAPPASPTLPRKPLEKTFRRRLQRAWSAVNMSRPHRYLWGPRSPRTSKKFGNKDDSASLDTTSLLQSVEKDSQRRSSSGSLFITGLKRRLSFYKPLRRHRKASANAAVVNHDGAGSSGCSSSATDNANRKQLKTKSSWISSWSSNLHACTRAPRSDDENDDDNENYPSEKLAENT